MPGRSSQALFRTFVSAVRRRGIGNTYEFEICAPARKDREIAGKVKGAMLYPMIVLIATFVLGLVISFVVLPQIIPLFKGRTGLADYNTLAHRFCESC